MKKDDFEIIDLDNTKNMTLLSEEVAKELCKPELSEENESEDAVYGNSEVVSEDAATENEKAAFEVQNTVCEEESIYEDGTLSDAEDFSSGAVDIENSDDTENVEDIEDIEAYEGDISEDMKDDIDEASDKVSEKSSSKSILDDTDIIMISFDEETDDGEADSEEDEPESEDSEGDFEVATETDMDDEEAIDGDYDDEPDEDSSDYYEDEDYSDYAELQEDEETHNQEKSSKVKNRRKKHEVSSPEEAELLYADEQFVHDQDKYMEEGYVEDYIEDGEIDFDDEVDFTNIDELESEEDDEIDPGMMDDDEYEAYQEDIERKKSKEPKEISFAEKVKKKITRKLKKMKPVDYLIYGTGAAIFIVAIVLLFVLGGPTANETSLYQVGYEYASIGMSGTQGINAMSLRAMEAVNAANEAETEVIEEEEEEPEEIDASEIKVTFTSFNKDLKIKFLASEQNRLITDIDFEITLTYETADNKNLKKGEKITLKDDDKDGIIYKEGLEGGDYSVSVSEVAGSKFVEIPDLVKVKGAIEYQVIDVTNEIKKESEINAAAEDTKINNVVEEAPTVSDTVEYVDSSKTAEGDDEQEEFTEVKFEDINIPPLALNIPNVRETICELNDYLALHDNKGEAYMELRKLVRGQFVSIASSQANIKVGESFVAKIDASSDGQVYWTQSGDAVEISSSSHEDATITGIAPGKSTVTVIWTSDIDGSTDEASFTVNVAEEEKTGGDNGESGGNTDDDTSKQLVSIELSNTNVVLTVGSKEKVIFTAKYSDGSSEAITGINWSSADQNIATVNENGKITGVAAGQTTVNVSYTYNGVTKEGNVNVTVTAENAGGDNSNGNSDNSASGNNASDGDGEKSYSSEAKLTTKNGNVEVYVWDESINAYRIATGADYKSTNKFYIKNSAVQYTYRGWQTIDGNTYYFDKDGKKVTGTQVIQGVTYTFTSDGILATNTSGIKGIDVSKWNGSIDWAAVKASGINYVIIRCGYRGSTTGALVEDPTFRTNIAGAKAAGLKVGIYFFTQAINEAEAIEEASMAVSLARQCGGVNYPIFIDTEDSGGRADRIDKGTRTAVCKAFCQTVQNSGYSAGVYASKSWFQVKVDYGSLSSYKIWLAQYASQATLGQRYDIWQYSSKGSVPGIKGNVDMNISYLGY